MGPRTCTMFRQHTTVCYCEHVSNSKLKCSISLLEFDQELALLGLNDLLLVYYDVLTALGNPLVLASGYWVISCSPVTTNFHTKQSSYKYNYISHIQILRILVVPGMCSLIYSLPARLLCVHLCITDTYT